MNHLKELKNLKLPKDKFAVFGSGSMAIRGLRENKDIDIIVKEGLWKKLSVKYEVKYSLGLSPLLCSGNHKAFFLCEQLVKK
ncbi:MAG: hypothetical protein AABY09_01560 [Nanoarchaeota archaeon]